MTKKFKLCSTIAFLTVLSACTKPFTEQQIDRGAPRSLMDISSETVTLGLDGKKSLATLTKMVDANKPKGAELRCSLNSARCAQAKEIFERRAIPIYLTTESSDSVALLYERVIIRDCEQHFVDNMSGNRSLNHPAFGCATTGNIVQMVADKRQFTNPNLLDFPDAEKANQSYNNYLKPASKREYKEPDWDASSK